MYGWISLALLAQFEFGIPEDSSPHVLATVNKLASPKLKIRAAIDCII